VIDVYFALLPECLAEQIVQDAIVTVSNDSHSESDHVGVLHRAELAS
jgi:hypothetical protein